jgi:hypothetical protein
MLALSTVYGTTMSDPMGWGHFGNALQCLGPCRSEGTFEGTILVSDAPSKSFGAGLLGCSSNCCYY